MNQLELELELVKLKIKSYNKFKKIKSEECINLYCDYFNAWERKYTSEFHIFNTIKQYLQDKNNMVNITNIIIHINSNNKDMFEDFVNL